MVKQIGAVVTNFDSNLSYEIARNYFTSIGFEIIQDSKPYQMILQRGSLFWGSDWRTKKMSVKVDITESIGNSTLIKCEYDINFLLYDGKEANRHANEEIEGLKAFISTYNQPNIIEKDRICVNCRKKIPWDAIGCPYCGKKL